MDEDKTIYKWAVTDANAGIIARYKTLNTANQYLTGIDHVYYKIYSSEVDWLKEGEVAYQGYNYFVIPLNDEERTGGTGQEILLPCPFCGAKPTRNDGDFLVKHNKSCWLSQNQSHDENEWIIRDEAKKSWNKRYI